MVVSLLIKRLKARSGPLIDEVQPFRRCLSQLIGAACFPRREKSVYDRENESSALCHFSWKDFGRRFSDPALNLGYAVILPIWPRANCFARRRSTNRERTLEKL